MKAVVHDRYGPPEVLALREVEVPVPEPGEVLVRVHAAGMDQGVWHLTAGLPYLVRVAGFGLRRPKRGVRGADLAGTVEAVGAGVERFRRGDRVFGTSDGSYAEFVRTSEDRLAPMPASLDFRHAAVLPVSGQAALQAVRDQGRVAPGERVLVIGAGGGVGTFAVQIAKAFGATVTGFASTAKVGLVRALGADEVIDRTREEVGDRAERYDVIIDTAGNRPLRQLRRALAARGTLVIVGGETGGRWLGGFQRQIWALVLSPVVGQRLVTWVSRERREDLEELGRLVDAGAVRPVLDRTFGLEEVPAAMHHLRAGGTGGKTVIDLEQGGKR